MLVATSVCVCAVHCPACPLTLFPSDGLRGHFMSGMQPGAGNHLIGVTHGPELPRGISSEVKCLVGVIVTPH